MPKVVFIAHPVSGDEVRNLASIITIMRDVHSEDVIPIHPSFATREYLTDTPTHKALAEAHIEQYFKTGFVEELWLYGERISEGMWREIRVAAKYSIPIVPKSRETKEVYAKQCEIDASVIQIR